MRRTKRRPSLLRKALAKTPFQADMSDEYPFPTNTGTAIAMWSLLVLGVVLGVAADNMMIMIVLAVIGVLIHSAGLVNASQ